MRTPSKIYNPATGVRVDYDRRDNGDIECSAFDKTGARVEHCVVSLQDARRFHADDRRHGFIADRRHADGYRTSSIHGEGVNT